MGSVSGKYLKDETGAKFSPVTSVNTVVGSTGTKLSNYINGQVVFSGKIQGTQTLSGVDWSECDYLWFNILLTSSGNNFYSWVKLTHDNFTKNTSIVLTNGIVIGAGILYIDAMNMVRISNNNTYAIRGSDKAENELWVVKIVSIPKM